MTVQERSKTPDQCGQPRSGVQTLDGPWTHCCSVTFYIFDRSKEQIINESKIVKEFEKDKNVRYFKLPEDNGWNSGRAVLISQVQTEYFVTCDGDFVFNSATRIGKHTMMHQVAENRIVEDANGLTPSCEMISHYKGSKNF